MIIFKISKNGKAISQLGGEFIEMIHASVGYLKEKNRIYLTSSGLNEPDKKHHEHVRWFDQVSLEPGDEILIKVMDGDNPDTLIINKSFGDVVSDGGTTEYYCSFCGVKASADAHVLLSQNANICHSCLRRFNPDKDHA